MDVPVNATITVQMRLPADQRLGNYPKGV